MKKIYFFLAAVIMLTLCLSGCEKLPPEGDDPAVKELSGQELTGERIRAVGRTFYDDTDKQLCFYYTASGFSVTFKGTKLTAEISVKTGKAYFVASVDGQIAPEGKDFYLTEDIQSVTLAENLSGGVHTVTVLKRSEPMDGETSLKKLSCDGAFEKVSAKTGLKFQIVGGSGISGHGSLGKPGQSRTPANSSSLHAFGYLTARIFGADFQFVSNSGFGLVWGFRPINARKAYEYAGVDSDVKAAGGQWNHNSYVPDVVLVNIGGNDFDSHDMSTAAEKKKFRDAVIEFLKRIHSLYPNAKVIWTHTGSQNGIQAETAISDYDPKQSKVKVVVIPKVGADGDAEGANGHNGLMTHIRTADILADAINGWLGYSKILSNITA